MVTSFPDPGGEKAVAILAWGGQKDASEGAPEDVRAGKAAAVGDFVKALRRPLEQAPGCLETQFLHVTGRGPACFAGEDALKVAWAHRHSPGQGRH